MIELSLNDKAKNLLYYANEHRKSGLFNDINIQVENERFPCNKMVLSCYSTYFQTMFRTEMQEQYQDAIELQGFNGKYIKMLIDYMYGETIVIDDENVLQILAAADCLQLQDVKDFCIEYLKTSLLTCRSTANCLDVLTAYSLYLPNLSRDHIYLFISENFDAVFHQEKFKNFSIHDLKSLLTNINKNKVNQESMFSAVISWVEHFEEDRKDDFLGLFDLLDLSQLCTDFIQTVVMKNPLVAQNNRCLKLIIKTLTSKFTHVDFQHCTSMEGGSTIVCLGGEYKKLVMELFNISGKLKTSYPDLPKTMVWHCAVKVDKFMFCIGGLGTNQVYRLNLTNHHMKWTEVALMNEKRNFLAGVVFRGNIIVSGGVSGLERSSTAEMYEISSDKWIFLQSMIETRIGHASVVCSNCLYVIGGLGLNSVEKLSGLGEKWELAPAMNRSRNRLAAVCLEGAIYAIGGWSNGVEKSVEKLVPAENNKWSYVVEMNTARWGHAACVMGGKIYVVGGKDEKGNFVTTIECYDPMIDSWSIVAQNVDELEGHAIVVV